MKSITMPSQSIRNIFYIILLMAVVGAGFGFYSVRNAPVRIPAQAVISQNELQNKYGLHVNLVALTAAGGMVDLRLKMLDGEKAKLMLEDKKNFPALYVGGTRVTLKASEDSQAGEIKFEDNNNLFLMFPNTGNALKQGGTVSILFGDTALEPIVVK